jgi:hypothetical protein
MWLYGPWLAVWSGYRRDGRPLSPRCGWLLRVLHRGWRRFARKRHRACGRLAGVNSDSQGGRGLSLALRRRGRGSVHRPLFTGALAGSWPLIWASAFRCCIIYAFILPPDTVVARRPIRVAADFPPTTMVRSIIERRVNYRKAEDN